jgi:hypothetical protein
MLYTETQLLPSGDIDAANHALSEGTVGDFEAGHPIHRFDVEFSNGFRMQVLVVAAGSGLPAICTQLHDAEGEPVRNENCLPAPVDQEYNLEYDNHVYRYVIERAAVAHLTEEMIAAYIRDGGVGCPHCGCDDMTQGKLLPHEGNASCVVTCCSCDARWRDKYTLTAVEPVDPPTKNVPEADTQEEQ